MERQGIDLLKFKTIGKKRYTTKEVIKNKSKEPFSYINECYDYINGYKGISGFLIYDEFYYIVEYKNYQNTGKTKYSLVIENQDWFEEDLEKLEKILYEYVREML